jgi:hypothetical protein
MIHKLPALSDPVKYTGLYIFDFGDHVSVGYTAEEIAYLLADEKYADGEVYKIYRAHADGTLELRSVDPHSWGQTTGMIFWFADRQASFDALDELKSLSTDNPPPGEFEALVVHTVGQDFVYALVMRYSQELDDVLASWLLKIDYQAGQQVEAGRKKVQSILANSTELLREQFGADGFRQSRSMDDVLNSVEKPIQR